MTVDFAQMLQASRNDPNYAGNTNFGVGTTWVPTSDGQSELLVRSTDVDDVAHANETDILTGSLYGQVRGNRSYVFPDAHYNPDRPTTWQEGRGDVDNLIGGNGLFMLGPVPRSVSQALHDEWPTTQDELKKALKKCLPAVAKSGFPVKEGETDLNKLVHSWWDKRVPAANQHPIEGMEMEERIAYLNGLDADIAEPFRMANLPVQPRLIDALHRATLAHTFNPLCAYMHETPEVALRPAEYATILPGATVKATFTLTHKLIKRPHNTTSHFTATVSEIEVLQRAHVVELSPAKSAKKNMFQKRGPDSEGGPSSNVRSKRSRVA